MIVLESTNRLIKYDSNGIFSLKIEILSSESFVVLNNSFKNYKKSSIPALLFVLLGWFLSILYLEDVWYFFTTSICALLLLYITYFWASLKSIEVNKDKIILLKYNIVGILKKREYQFTDLESFEYNLVLDNSISKIFGFLKSISYYCSIIGEKKRILIIRIPFIGSLSEDAKRFCKLMNRMLDEIKQGKPLDIVNYDPKAYILKTFEKKKLY